MLQWDKGVDDVRKKTHEEFVKEMKVVHGDEYTVTGTYRNVRTKISVKHELCGNVFEATPKNLTVNKSGCPVCSFKRAGEKLSKSPEEFAKEFDGLHNGEFELLTDYVRSSKKVLVRHNSGACDYHEFEATPNNLISKKSGCPKCANNIKRDTNQFQHEVFKAVGDEYKVIGNYTSGHEKISMIHVICGHTYEVTPNKFLVQGRRCPNCKESKGERAIKDFLDSYGYRYKREVKLEGCEHVNPLRFDFAVYTGDKIMCLIEFDGEQHFMEKAVFGGLEGFELCKVRDRIKTTYCAMNQIQLIRIPYHQMDNIENILIGNIPQN